MNTNWEHSSAAGSTSLLSNSYDNQTQWQGVKIKTEPVDFSNFIQSTPPQQDMSSILPQSTLDLLEQMPSFRKIGAFNPLTPPGYSGMMFPSFLGSQLSKQQTTPPKAQDLSMTKSDASSITPPMDVTPPKSPSQLDRTPDKDHNFETRSESVESYDEESDDFDDDIDKSKKRKMNNKPRQYKCKQCKQIFFSKGEFWDHTRSHIKPEKMLQCPKCAFVTEYKHHLEYHLRNHSRSKPFACPHCNYSCVNKSMLNSHLKSHSSVLQYRCIDCNYATKYCHSLKLHLRKYGHKPDIVLNLDGTPNPLPIIDIYGTRRGPKSKATTSKLLAEIEKNQAQQQAQKAQLSPPLTPSTSSLQTTATNSITKTPPSSFPALMVSMLQNKIPLLPYFNYNLQLFAAKQKQQLDQFNAEMCQDNQTGEADTSFVESPPPPPPKKTISRAKRKGKAFKLDERINATPEDNVEAPTMAELDNSNVTSSVNLLGAVYKKQLDHYECKQCGIIFKDNVLYHLHIGYHSLGDDPFTCNICGIKTEDKVQFFLHIAKFPHP